MIVLKRFDSVLEPKKEELLKKHEELKVRYKDNEEAVSKELGKLAAEDRKHPILYNTSPYTLRKLLNDPENIASNLVSYIKGFSPKVRAIFDEYFEFENEITKLEKANRLYQVIHEFCSPDINLHPERVSNLQMGYVFEELVRKFNEQANEEAGDHFTPREVIRLIAHLIYTEDEDVYKPHIIRKLYDPACGTGGMLSISEEYIKEQNPDAHLVLYGQEYNEESYAICTSDLLIKDEDADKIVFGDTLGDGKTFDGHKDEKFHYMMANPPFGVEWKSEENYVKSEYEDLGFSGRFGPGLPRINDGSLLFLLHMMSKMQPSPDKGGDGSKIGIVFNGSPLFTGDAGSGESNIRRWIIENDMLDTVVALPDQLFYNTGIYTYIWLVTNRKREERRGKVQLIDATHHFQKMKKSLGNKRNELSDKHIEDITRLYGNFAQDDKSELILNGDTETRICSKIFNNQEFGYLKITVERPLRLKLQVTDDRVEALKVATPFINIAKSKKKFGSAGYLDEVKAGEKLQEEILNALDKADKDKIYMNREKFIKDIKALFKREDIKVPAPVLKAIWQTMSERDENADICTDAKGNPEPDPELRDAENVPLKPEYSLPLPIDYDKNADNSKLVDLVHDDCEEYLKAEVLPHVADAWIDHSKTKVGYEIPINRHFYVYKPPRALAEIEADIKDLEKDIISMLKDVVD
jgi:type I restriction enzyme M protein